MQNIYQLTLESDVKEVIRVESLVKTMSLEHHFESKFVHDVMLIITEATNNAIMHGNRYDKNKEASLRCEINGDELNIIVTDQGEGFNPDGLPDPLAEENLLKPSGRGVFLMRQYAKHINYDFSSKGTTLQITIAIQREVKS